MKDRNILIKRVNFTFALEDDIKSFIVALVGIGAVGIFLYTIELLGGIL